MVCDVSITRFFEVSIRRMWQELFPVNVSLCGNILVAYPHPRRIEPVPHDDDARERHWNWRSAATVSFLRLRQQYPRRSGTCSARLWPPVNDPVR